MQYMLKFKMAQSYEKIIKVDLKTCNLLTLQSKSLRIRLWKQLLPIPVVGALFTYVTSALSGLCNITRSWILFGLTIAEPRSLPASIDPLKRE